MAQKVLALLNKVDQHTQGGLTAAGLRPVLLQVGCSPADLDQFLPSCTDEAGHVDVGALVELVFGEEERQCTAQCPKCPMREAQAGLEEPHAAQTVAPVQEESAWERFDGKELEEPIESGWVRVLDSHYLVDLASRGGVIHRRQNMPEEAYVSLKQLKGLGVYTKDAGSTTKDEQTWLPLVILSYPWLTAAHPDPQGETLATVAEALKGLGDPHGVIIDFTALPQLPRSASEEATFRSGLRSLNLFYTHPYVVVFKVTEFPPGYPNAGKYGLGGDVAAVPYDQRGWCFAETCMAGLGGKPKLVSDISHLRGRALGGGGSAAPQPPLSPAAFNLKLRNKTFTQAETDTERVKTLYLRAFDIRIRNAKSLRFPDLGWGAAEVHELAEVLVSNTQMERLDLFNNKCGVEGARAVALVLRTHGLLVLDLRSCALGDAGAAEIAEALMLNNTLTTLNLNYNGIGHEGARALGKVLKVNGTLTSLSLNYNDIGDEGAGALGEALEVNKALTILELANVTSTCDKGGRALAEALKLNNTLATLSLEHGRIGAEGGRALGESLQVNRALTTLNLRNNELCDEGGWALAEALKVNSALVNLHLRSNRILVQGGKALGEALSVNRTLANLNLMSNRLGDEGGRMLGEALKVNSALQKLNLVLNNIGGEGGRALGEALKVNSALTELGLFGNKIGAEGGRALAGALKVNKALTNLDLRGTSIGNEGGYALGEALKVNVALRKLDLMHCNLGAEAGRALGEGLLVNKALMTLDLYGNEIGDEGGQALAEALKINRALTALNVCFNRIGDEGGRALGEALKVNEALTCLNLKLNCIGIEGGRALGEALKVNNALSELCLADNRIGAQGGSVLDEAKAARPGCKFVW